MAESTIFIFNTISRYGKQVSRCTEKTTGKVEQNALGVDNKEAGFPISSPRDYETVNQTSKKIEQAITCTLSRAAQKIKYYFTSTIGDLSCDYVTGCLTNDINHLNIELRKSMLI